MSISSPGIGSSLDVNNIVSQLIAVDRKPITLLDKKTASFQAKLSGFGTLKSILSQFQTAVGGLANISKFQGVKTSIGDATVATASGSSIAVPGSYALEISKLAQTQKLNAIGQASATAPIGSGATTTISFDFGTISAGTLNSSTGKYTGASFASAGSGIKTVTIDASNNTLGGIRDAINKANLGVSATIVNDGSGTPYRLSLAVNASGKANSLKISVAGDTAVSSLLSHDPAADAGQALSETQTAQNAQFKIDGIDISKGSNSVTDVIPGVTLNLAKTNVGTPTSITVARDTASVISSVGAFVKAFNDVNQHLKDASAFDPITKQAAILNGEASVRSIQNQVRVVLNAPVSGGASAYSLLFQIGVTLQKDGSLQIDDSKLQTAVNGNFADIAGLFSNVGKSSDALVSYTSASSKTAAGAYAVNVTQLASQGSSTASGAAGLTITAGVNDAVTVNLDGVSSAVTLTAGTYASAAALATELQSRINGTAVFSASSVSVTQNAGVLAITSAAFGANSNASVTGGNGSANLQFSAATVTLGKNVAGTLNGVVATGIGQSLIGAAGGPADGLNVQISGGLLGARGTINYSQGYAYQLNKLMTSVLGSDGPIASRTNGINTTLNSIAKSKDELNAQLVQTEKRYRAQYTALDSIISKMSQTSSFLSQQLSKL